MARHLTGAGTLTALAKKRDTNYKVSSPRKIKLRTYLSCLGVSDLVACWVLLGGSEAFKEISKRGHVFLKTVLCNL